MFTSRAENRLSLRADTAPLRLCDIAIKNNMLNKEEKTTYKTFLHAYNKLYAFIKSSKITYNNKKIHLFDYVKRPEVQLKSVADDTLSKYLTKLEGDVIFSVETAIKYEGYEKRELERIEKIKKLDGLLIPKQINYADISNLSSESKEKLSTVMPETLGQASRISGVRPSDVAVLSIYLTSQKQFHVKQKRHRKTIAKLSLQNETLSPLNAIDLSLLSQTSGVICVSKNEYVEIISSYALVLDRPEVLVLPLQEERANVEGFISIYDKLLEKFSWYANNSFDGVSLIVAIKGCDNYYYKHTEDEVIIDGSSTYDDAVTKLKKVGYERVDFIESPKQYCLKGGIIDVYSILSRFPYRFCFYYVDFSINNYNLSNGLSLVGSVLRINLFKS